MGEVQDSADKVPDTADSAAGWGSLGPGGPEAAEAGEGLIRCNRQGLIGTMVAGCIHEINNPNNNILLASRLLGDYWKGIAPFLTEYQAQHPEVCCAGMPLSGLLDSVPRIIAMIAEDVGRISRITGQMKSHAAPAASDPDGCDPAAVIGGVAESLKGTIARYTRQFRLELADDLPRVAIPGHQLHQVVTNLVCNALQSLPSRERVVTVCALKDERSGQIIIKVDDQGCGIEPEHLGRVFEPFYTVTPEHGRPGLGLFVSRLIIQSNQGTLTLSSDPGQGSSAVIRLPYQGV
jgi:signal transduction histidine kinase